MSATECKRCGGEGMGQYAHRAAGMCYACGRAPRREVVAVDSGAASVSDRDRVIAALYAYVLRAKDELADGEHYLSAWLDDRLPYIQAQLNIAPDDVRARAIAAFARLGITV